jgi:cob(I)alamin adenosyltransferase
MNTSEMNKAHRELDNAEAALESARNAYIDGSDRDPARMNAARARVANAEGAVLSLTRAIYF